MAGFNFNHLFYFYMTAKMGGVTEAARKLNTSQSSLSSQLKILEANLDIQLFLKAGRRLELTDRGEAVLAHCEKIFGAADSLHSFVETITGDNSPLIRFGVGKDICGSFISRVLGKTFLCTPGQNSTRVRVEASNSADLRKKLQMRELDIVLTSESIPADGVQYVRRINLPVFLFAAKEVADKIVELRAPVRDILAASDLDLALPVTGSALRQECESYLADNGVKKRVIYESNSIDSLMGMIQLGHAMGFAPTAYARTSILDGKVVPLGPKEPCWTHQMFLYSQSEKDGQNIISAMEAAT